MSSETIFRVSFLSQGDVYEVYARNVSQGGLFGFIEIEELVFGERSIFHQPLNKIFDSHQLVFDRKGCSFQ